MEPEAGTATDRSSLGRAYLAIGCAYLGLGSLVKATLPFPDLTDFWVPACRLVLEGRPQDLYSVRLQIFGQAFPNSYPPLFFLMLTPFVALADALGLSYGGYDGRAIAEGFGASVVGLPLLAGDLALAGVLCQAARERLDRADRLWLFALLLVQPALWFSSVRVQHHESWLLAALVGAALCVEAGRAAWAVALAAFALCLKTTAVLALPALALGLLRQGHRRAAAAMLLAPPLAVLALLAPWLALRSDQVSYALVRFESMRPIFGVSAAKLVAGTALEPAAITLSNPAMLLLAALVPAALGSLRQGLACVFLLALLLSRWVYPHYLLVPCGLLLLWELRRRSFPRLGLLGAGLLWALQSPYFPETTLEADAGVRLRALCWTLALLGLAAAVARGADQRLQFMGLNSTRRFSA
jgi:hypothetical protein